MTFIVTLIALLIERFFDWSHVRSWNWFQLYQRALANRLPKQSASVIFAISIILVLIAALFIQWLFSGVLFGILSFLFNLVILLYCFGPKNFWAQTFANINNVTYAETEALATTASAQQKLLSETFIEANKRIFGCLFWFVILGACGALLYRMISLSTENPVTKEIENSANKILSLLDWLSIRFFTFIFALSGHFSNVFSSWRKYFLQKPESNEKMLVECGVAALNPTTPLAENADSEINNAVHLIDRTLIIVMVIILIGVLLV